MRSTRCPLARRAPAPIRVVDFGCGKGYLTFAVHAHLRQRFGVAPRGRRRRAAPDLVAFCNGVAERSARRGLRFVEGDLRSFVPEAVDVMIALHACDTATDHAIALGVRAGAERARLLAVLPQGAAAADDAAAPLAGLLRHGMHLGQEAEMVTDSLRALLLETCGYDAQGVRVRLARAHPQEQDDPRDPARRRRRLADRAQAGGERPQVVLRHPRAMPRTAASPTNRTQLTLASGPPAKQGKRSVGEVSRPRCGSPRAGRVTSRERS